MTYTTVAAVRAGLVTAIDAVSGVNGAPAYAPSNPADFPFVAVYIGAPNIQPMSDSALIAYWDFHVDLYVAQQMTPDALQALEAFPEAIVNAIAKNLRDNTTNYKSITGPGFSPALDWAGVQCLGIQFVVREVKFPSVTIT